MEDPLDAHAARSENDRSLAASLLLDRRVRDAREALERQGRQGTRRSLLARALRLTPQVAPEVHALLERCREAVGVDTEVELYVHASPTFNAGCTPEEDGRVFVLVTSALLEAFDEVELLYVLGHELGHHAFAHHDIPLQPILQTGAGLPASFVLRAFAWQRYAEISADRAGMLCCGGLDGVARGLFKLSSGLHRAPGSAQLEAFVAQAHELYQEHEGDSTERAAHADFLSSHPFSPVRLRAAVAFDGVLRAEWDLATAEQAVVDLMALMEPSYLEEDSAGAEAMRRLLFAAGVVLAGADGAVSREEREALDELLGAGTVPTSLDPERLRPHLEPRIAEVVRLVPASRRAQLVRDLAVVARADGVVDPEEVAELRAMATSLEVSPRIVEVALAAPMEVD